MWLVSTLAAYVYGIQQATESMSKWVEDEAWQQNLDNLFSLESPETRKLFTHPHYNQMVLGVEAMIKNTSRLQDIECIEAPLVQKGKDISTKVKDTAYVIHMCYMLLKHIPVKVI